MRTLSIALASLACVAACAQTATPPAATVPNAKALTGTARTTTASGIVFENVVTGSGASPKATDTVTVHYRGTFPDGREFDSSYKRGQPTAFPLNRVIPCWTEAVQLMKPGGKARITCPPQLAYGERGAGGVIPPNATLVFEIELVKIGT
ncbi:FKBP-type peptidyl-prolyl cis-trans isomerase [Ramlibacter sp. USB13]|uniref:Peptidyl-prolyl cis-trans isomerase n=1 Tax=Ramlibacter cellulosilyticus TaxID=2764187 RepID=A0A923SC71_9BURK|nr:FKBP-type peptidyl-prolyl cis-trans isomerase [Ramlibacter cellulosilyticus]MBC5783928.1 FKBP-type peptidyl-prolyl cis-trans isomerase [Ramlibacter cellulosilyticus]